MTAPRYNLSSPSVDSAEDRDSLRSEPMVRKPANPVWGHTPSEWQVVDWNDYRIFAAVARVGSFTKAATELGIQQPTVSRRIESLEKRIGVRLFDRGARGPSLTLEGQRVLGNVNAARMHLDRAAEVGRRADMSVNGECKIMMSEGIASAWFARFFLPIFLRRYPDIEVRLHTTTNRDRSFIPPFDIRVRFAPASEPDLVTSKIGTLHFNLFASREYLNLHGEPKSIDELAGHRLIDVNESVKTRGRWATYSDATASARAIIFTNSGSIAAEAVLNGSAVGFLPSYAFVTAAGFIPIIPDFHQHTGIHVTFARGAEQRPSVRAMIDFLRNNVFNFRLMPWFGDGFVFPEEAWRWRLNELTEDRDIEPKQKPKTEGPNSVGRQKREREPKRRARRE